MSTTLIIRNGRLSFDKNLLDPDIKKKSDGKEVAKYTCNVIVGPDTEVFVLEPAGKRKVDRAGLAKLCEAALKEKFNGKVPPKYDNWAVRSNENAVSATTGDRFTGYEDDDGFYFSPSTYNRPPGFFRRDLTPLDLEKPSDLAEARQLFYGGCYCDFKLNLGAFEAKENGAISRGVTTYLESVRFLKHGEPFGSAKPTAEGFDELPDEDDI